ncbi:MAG: mandelate racemase/muconate lactonizing enzyme family protein, partial [Gaiellaceae bacterium]
LFVGEDPLAVERHARVLETRAFHAGRYWPREAALWDLAGKAKGVPAARLLGGAADRLPVYASCGEASSPEARTESARALREAGFRALKIRIERSRVEDGLATVRAVREALGSAMDVIVDLNQGWRMPGDASEPLPFEPVRRLAGELRDLEVLWLEEPLPRHDVAGHVALRETGIAVAAGEMAREPAELERFFEADALDVYQPDGVLAVGLLRARELAERVLARGRRFTPHTWTNGIGLLANLHLAAGVGGGPFVEYPYDPPGWTPARRDFMLAEPLRPDGDGFLAVPDRPGLGVELDEEALRRYAAD